MSTKNPEKKVDVPPQGDRNPDPLTDAPGSHPIETGIGAAAAGAATADGAGVAVAGTLPASPSLPMTARTISSICFWSMLPP